MISFKLSVLLTYFQFSVRLIATVLPRHSRYLPHIPGKHTDYFYPYMCYQLVCERLYGQAGCFISYSDEIPQTEYSDNFDMVVTKVSLS